MTLLAASVSQVTLKSADGQLSVDGNFLPHKGSIYTIETQLETLQQEKSLVSCEGIGCSTALAATVRVAANQTVAQQRRASAIIEPGGGDVGSVSAH